MKTSTRSPSSLAMSKIMPRRPRGLGSPTCSTPGAHGASGGRNQPTPLRVWASLTRTRNQRAINRTERLAHPPTPPRLRSRLVDGWQVGCLGSQILPARQLDDLQRSPSVSRPSPGMATFDRAAGRPFPAPTARHLQDPPPASTGLSAAAADAAALGPGRRGWWLRGPRWLRGLRSVTGAVGDVGGCGRSGAGGVRLGVGACAALKDPPRRAPSPSVAGSGTGAPGVTGTGCAPAHLRPLGAHVHATRQPRHRAIAARAVLARAAIAHLDRTAPGSECQGSNVAAFDTARVGGRCSRPNTCSSSILPVGFDAQLTPPGRASILPALSECWRMSWHVERGAALP